MTKIAKVEAFLIKNGWIDSLTIRKLTNTTSTRSYVYKLNKQCRLRTIARTVTPTYTRWLLIKGKS